MAAADEHYTFHDDRPPIRVRNGGSIDVRTDLGSFIAERDEWRQDHSETTAVRTLEVEVVTGVEKTRLVGPFVRITYRVNGRERHVVIRARQLCWLPWKGHVYVVPGTPTVEDRGTELVLDKAQETTLVRVAVGRYPGDSSAQTHVVGDGAVTRVNIYPRGK